MTKGNLIKNLFKAYSENDHLAVKKIADEIIKDEREKSHYRLANSLQEIVDSFPEEGQKENNLMGSSYFNRIPRDDRSGADLVSIVKPKYYIEDVILSQDNKKIINHIMIEHYNVNRLKNYNLDAKRRLLFCGPPGCGKTMTAHALANEIGLPLLYIHMDSLISSYLGDTASNLREIFKYAEQGRWVIFFDEFDTIGKNRDDENEHGELKRAVNTFLQMLDNFKTETLLIAATNHQHLLDKAIWRRFEEILYFDKPDLVQIKELLKKKLTFKTEENIEETAKDLKGMSHAQIEQICQDAIKYCIINNIKIIDRKVLKEALKEERRRQEIYNGRGGE